MKSYNKNWLEKEKDVVLIPEGCCINSSAYQPKEYYGISLILTFTLALSRNQNFDIY